jgi:hypothetical protein
MAWLIPDITRPVTLKLTAADAKREALGRTLGLAGAGVGILGGLMILSANPAVQAALMRTKTTPMTLTLTPAQAKRDALGKALAIVGMTTGVVGSALVMTTDPTTKSKLTGVYQRLPASVQAHKSWMAYGLAAAAVAATWYLIRNQNQSLMRAYQ